MRLRRCAAVVLLFGGVGPPAAWLALQVALNVALPVLINRRPERISVHWTAAWMVVPWRVEVRGLAIRAQGPRDQWLLRFDRASAELDVDALRDRTLHVRDLQVDGADYRYRRRVADGATARDSTPPIDGLSNPPDRAPEQLYPPARPWKVVVDGASIDGVREVWIEDYRLVGASHAEGRCALGGPSIDAHLELSLGASDLSLGNAPMADGLGGRVAVDVAHLDRSVGLTRASLSAVRARVALETHVSNLDFLDFYLARVPWLTLEGTGHVAVDATLADGRIIDGSWLRADTSDLAVRFLGYTVAGDAEIRGDVAAVDGTSKSHLAVEYGAYSIAEDLAPPLATGQGFLVDAWSPDVALDRPFTALDASLDLPPTEIPDFTVFNHYLPEGVGLTLHGGQATVHGHLTASIPGSLAKGDLWLDSQRVSVRFDELDLAASLALHAHLEEGALLEHRYDFSGSRVDVSGLWMRDPADPDVALVGDRRPWSARIEARSAVATPGQPTMLDAQVSLRCSDSVPFVAIAAHHKPLAGWVQRLLAVRDVSGRANIQFGKDSIDLRSLAIEGGQNLEVLLQWLRRPSVNRGTLFGRFGALSFGMSIDGPDRELHVPNARGWFAERTGFGAR